MESILYTGSIGINNKVTSHRLSFNEKSGVSALQYAMDVLIDRTGEIVTRRGSVLIKAGSFHSKFKLTDGSFYAIEERDSDSALFKFVPNNDGSLEEYGIISGLPSNAKMDFIEVGDRILYCNGAQNGVLIDDVSYPWTDQDWTGPDSDIEMVKPPVGEHIDFLSGRALLSKSDELFYSEHGLIGLVDELKNRVKLESRIIMVCAVQTGVFISDSKFVYFVSGTNPNEWLCKKVLNYPAVEWCREQGLINPMNFGFESNELAVLFGTVNGPVVGLSSGIAVNLIDKSVTMPVNDCSSGAIMVVDETTIIQN